MKMKRFKRKLNKLMFKQGGIVPPTKSNEEMKAFLPDPMTEMLMYDLRDIQVVEPLDFERYTYHADLMDLYDGDTITVMVDFGLDTFKKAKFRLARIDAWERRGEEKVKGDLAREALLSQIQGKEIILETIRDKTGKYGRYIAELWVDHDGDLLNMNDWLVREDHAIYKDY